MTKTLEQIQKENRKLILQAIHCCSYEEALEKELGFNCEVLARVWRSYQIHRIDNLTCFFDGDYLRFRELVGDICKKDLTDEGLERLEEYESARHRIIEIIGKPLTLSRVLLAFSRKIFKNEISLQFPDFLHVNGFNWNLIKETLEEQSEETQREINKLLTII